MLQCSCTAYSYSGEEQCVWCGLILDRKPLQRRDQATVRPPARQRTSPRPPFWDITQQWEREKQAELKARVETEKARQRQSDLSKLAEKELTLEQLKQDLRNARHHCDEQVPTFGHLQRNVARAERRHDEALQVLNETRRRTQKLLDEWREAEQSGRNQLRGFSPAKTDRLYQDAELSRQQEKDQQIVVDETALRLKLARKRLAEVESSARALRKNIERIRTQGIQISQEIHQLREKLRLD